MFWNRNVLKDSTPIYMGIVAAAPKDWCFLDNSLVFSDVICFYYKNIKCAVKLVLEILRKSCYNVSQVTWLYRMGAN